jgi:hypothetical protein
MDPAITIGVDGHTRTWLILAGIKSGLSKNARFDYHRAGIGRYLGEIGLDFHGLKIIAIFIVPPVG